ncbi:unnamed protein product [Prunus brigantina]
MEAANIVLSPALQVIFDRLASPVLQKAADFLGFDDNFRGLQHAVERAQATLEDAEDQQFTSRAVRLWLSKLKNAAYDADDDLHYLTAKGMEEKADAIKVSGMLCFQLGELMHATQTGAVLRALEATINEGLSEFNFKAPSMVDGRTTIRETSSFIIESEIYGREDDKEKLVKLLLSSEASQEGYATCISIFGIGGIGKTTLAQLGYNDDRVIHHFDVRMWIFVSDDFNVKKIMKAIIESATKDECKLSEIDLLQSQIWNLLHNKRYLIVLDDIWTENHDDWDKLRPLFRGGVDGCKIIVTTRNTKTAFMTDSPNSPFYLKGLAEDDCWTLFKQRAFGRTEEEKYPRLLSIGKQIVKKCGGVPLAVKSLGSLMRFKREEQQWLFMQNSDLWKLDACQNKVLPALMLSYIHLPSHLKQCFAFCSIFPRNYEFKKQKLIYLWMAEGLILQGGSKRPEDIGEDYFADLLWMSFFQEVELCEGVSITGYKMNDVIYDLARYVAGKEYVILEQGAPPNGQAKIRHSSVVYMYGEITIPEALYEEKHLRTLLLIGEYGSLRSVGKMFSTFVYLRSLDLSSCNVYNLPESLGIMICLRYLDVSYTPIRLLPGSTSNLCALQTLNLFGCHNLRSLPFLGDMTGLRHLDITGCQSLDGMCTGIECLCQLQTLPLFVVSWEIMHSFSTIEFNLNRSLSALQHLNLYGKLNIIQLGRVRNASIAHYAGLKTKENLELLGLYWGLYQGFEGLDDSFTKLHKAQHKLDISGSNIGPKQHEPDARVAEEILEGLQPHNNLKILVIHGYPGIKFPRWALPNIVSFHLAYCRNCERLPALGSLLLLKTVSLHRMDAVRCIGTEFYGDGADIRFPSLEELSISDFANLEEWSSANDGNAFPRLKKLTVKSCPKLAHIPLCQSLQHLELRDCNPTSMSTENLTLLSVLVIEKIPELSCLPEGFFASAHLSSLEILCCPKLHLLPSEMGNLTSLKSLTIRCCEQLSSLPQTLQNLKSLHSLEISGCHSIMSMPDGGIGSLCSLRTLFIESCSNLISLSSSLEHLTFLEHLSIMNCPNLGSFPEDVQHLSSLRSLTILSCPWFDALPNGLQNVPTLHCLEIISCPNLTALPEWFGNLASLRSLTISDCPNLKVLPPGQKLLTKLQHLSIQECPELEQRCRPGSGEDWLKIAHVPHKYVGSPQVSQSSEASTSGSSSVQTASQ